MCKKKLISLLDTGIASAEENMRRDEELLDGLEGEPILHLYRWSFPSLTYGYFIRPEEWLDLFLLKKSGLDLARRPTGGGLLFHLWDLAFSFLLPASHPKYSTSVLENYRFVNGAVARAVETCFPHVFPELAPHEVGAGGRFCMAAPTRYDVIFQGKKIAGAAQRKGRRGYLHQGTISLALPDFAWIAPLLLPGVRQEVMGGMERVTVPLLESLLDLEGARKNLETHLLFFLQNALCTE
ncbi:MAG: hypothetical protein KGI80_01410 [Verrucomicrobiota bacterium]|nr:hypothetical protein [Verrucomicrobiota bacterium]